LSTQARNEEVELACDTVCTCDVYSCVCGVYSLISVNNGTGFAWTLSCIGWIKKKKNHYV